MFYARIDNSFEFRKLLEVLKDIVPSVNFRINSSGISFESNEALHVVQVKLKIPVTYFSEFKCTGTFTLGTCLTDLLTLIKISSVDDSLVLTHEEGTTVLQVALEAKKIPKVCEFSLNLIDVNTEDWVYVEVETSGKFEMNSKELFGMCNDLSQVSEFLMINLNKLRVKFSVQTDLGGGSINLKQLRGENGMNIQTLRTVTTEINLIYAKRITKAYALSERVEVKVYPEEPVVFRYMFTGIELKFYLAPAISD